MLMDGQTKSMLFLYYIDVLPILKLAVNPRSSHGMQCDLKQKPKLAQLIISC